MKVLIGCEKSQIICLEFRKLGHEAYRCDIQECSGDHPEYHLHMDLFEAISLKKWDLMIWHPMCTHLAVSGARWFETKQIEQRKAIYFFLAGVRSDIPRICTENPVGIMSTLYQKPDQYIQPYNFNENASKKTCLWLKNLPLLENTGYYPPRIVNGKNRWGNQTDSGQNKLTPSDDRAEIRSLTYTGIAKAMAEQWGYVL
jgi:hypothetical protein